MEHLVTVGERNIAGFTFGKYALSIASLCCMLWIYMLRQRWSCCKHLINGYLDYLELQF